MRSLADGDEAQAGLPGLCGAHPAALRARRGDHGTGACSTSLRTARLTLAC